MWVYVVLCVPCVYVVDEGQKRRGDSLELVLELFLEPFMGSKNQTQVISKTMKHFFPLEHPLSSLNPFFYVTYCIL